MKFIFYLLLALLFRCQIASAQTTAFSDSIVAEKLSNYSKSHPSEILFVHTDKTIYTNNEQVWFSAYFINEDTVAINRHNYLSVSIVREDNKQIALENKYLIANGLCFGNLSLPDTIQPGKYMFTAFSNVVDQNNKPVALFTQLINIKSVINNTIKAKVTIIDSLAVNNTTQAMVKVEDEFFHSINNALITYTVNGQAFKTLLSNDKGVAVIPIPQKDDQQIVQVKISFNNDNQLLSFSIPGTKKDSSIVAKFYPESGNLVAGVENKVGIETTIPDGSPLSVKGILYRNNIVVDTIFTFKDGLTTFKITPSAGDHFLMKFFDANKNTIEFPLPDILTDGVTISMENALSNDTAIFNISSGMPRHLQVYIHNDANLFGSVSVNATQENKKIKLVLNDMPKGIVTITVTDTLGRPLAERLFFAHFYKRPSIIASTDTSTYSRHAEVTLKVKLADFENTPTGIVSIACVQANRLSNPNRNDIENYVYLKHLFENIPTSIDREIENKAYMENVLLIKGWRRYTWQTVMNTGLKDTIEYLRSIPTIGRIYVEEKPPKKPVELIIIKDSSLDLLSTDNKGSFIINPASISVQEGRKVFMGVNNNTSGNSNYVYGIKNNTSYNTFPVRLMTNFVSNHAMNYKIEIEDPLKIILNNLITSYDFKAKSISTNFIKDKEARELEIPTSKKLKEVVVRSKKDNLLYGGDAIKGSGMGPNECGDFVCLFDILNCPIHYNDFRNRTPVKGDIYYRYEKGLVIYSGCEIQQKRLETAIKIPGIYLSREFYGVEQKQKDIAEPEYQSTIFWKPGVIINNQKEVEFSFYTSDITGNFKVIIQGVTSNKNVVYKEISFRVTN